MEATVLCLSIILASLSEDEGLNYLVMIRSHLNISFGSSNSTYKNMVVVKKTASTIYLSVCSVSSVVFHLFI